MGGGGGGGGVLGQSRLEGRENGSCGHHLRQRPVMYLEEVRETMRKGNDH